MATASIEISKTVWTRITAAGQSGTVWKKAGGCIVIDHTDQETADTLPLTNTSVDKGKSKRIPLDEDSPDVLAIPADNSSDIYYAHATDNSDENTLVVDVI